MANRKLPKKVKIGWRTFDIDVCDINDEDDNEKLFGTIDYYSTTIRISKDLHYKEQLSTLLHEIIHGIFYQTGHTKARDNEDIIEALASGLFAVIQENPDLDFKD